MLMGADRCVLAGMDGLVGSVLYGEDCIGRYGLESFV